jgi:hypothetical protein
LYVDLPVASWLERLLTGTDAQVRILAKESRRV